MLPTDPVPILEAYNLSRPKPDAVALEATSRGQLVATLARVGQTEPDRLWRLVARCCRSAYASLTADPAIAAQAGRDEAALFGPTLPAKSMLRVHLSGDPHTPQWVAVPNPLAAAG